MIEDQEHNHRHFFAEVDVRETSGCAECASSGKRVHGAQPWAAVGPQSSYVDDRETESA